MQVTEIPETAWRWLDEPEVASGFDKRLAQMQVRMLRPGVAAARIVTGAGEANVLGGLHGGFLAAAAEQCLFLPLYLAGRIGRDGCVTVDFSVKYVAGGVAGVALEVEVTCLRETGRLGFVQGEMRQQGELVIAFTGTMRKLGKR